MFSYDINILIVDDVVQHITAACSILKPLGYPIRVANNGKEALNQVQQKKPTLILLDIGMADISGFDICSQLKSNVDYADIAIIFMTAHSDIESIEKGFSLGAQDYVIKPYHHKELLARVQTHIQLELNTKKLKQVNEQLDSFTRNVSHDLRSPLQVIRQLVEMLKEETVLNPTDNLSNILFFLEEKSNHAILLIDRLLELSRISSKECNFEQINVTSMIKKISSDLSYAYPQQTIIINFDALPQIYGDKILIQCLFQNILDNAVKFSQKKANSKIDIICSEDDSHIYMSFNDNGSGFNICSPEKLFQVFQRFHTQDYKGTGVGLSIMKCIMDRHKGSIAIESTEGIGTKVNLIFDKPFVL